VNNLAPTTTETDSCRFSTQTLFLIVDDDQDDLTLLERALKKVEVTASIYWALDGCEAIEALSRFRAKFHTICLVIDIQLPDMNGFELVEEIRGASLCEGLAFVFLTGNSSPLLRTRALGCGADAFFRKPSRHSDLVEIARQLNEICRKVSV
jgi:two-component system, chemotaxis family, chemotaxis protein CheY